MKQNFQVNWLSKWLWLHYHEDSDTEFCNTYIKAFKELSINVKNAKDTIISRLEAASVSDFTELSIAS